MGFWYHVAVVATGLLVFFAVWACGAAAWAGLVWVFTPKNEWVVDAKAKRNVELARLERKLDEEHERLEAKAISLQSSTEDAARAHGQRLTAAIEVWDADAVKRAG